MTNLKIKIMAGASTALILIMAILTFTFYPAFKVFSKMEKVEVDPHLTLLLGYGSNSGVLVSDTDDKKTLVIDTKIMGGATALNELVGEKSRGGEITVVNTHYHSDHTGGNKFYKGETILAGAYDREVWDQDNKPDGEPTEWIKDQKTLQIGTEKVTILNVGQAHTYQDLVVYLHNRNTLFTGDLVFHHWHPVLRKESGANIEKWRQALSDLTSRFRINRAVPGHGAVSDGSLLIMQAAYFARIENAIYYSDAEKRLKTLEKRYEDYYSLPFFSGFDKTVEYLRANP